MGSEPNMNPWCALTAKVVNSSWAVWTGACSIDWGTRLSTLYIVFVRSYFETASSFGPQLRKDMGKWWGAQWRAPRERLAELGWVRLEKGWLQCTKQTPSTSERSSRRWRWSCHSGAGKEGKGRWVQERFGLSIRQNRFPIRTMRQWSRFPCEVISLLPLVGFKPQLVQAVRSPELALLWAGNWTRDLLRSLSAWNIPWYDTK